MSACLCLAAMALAAFFGYFFIRKPAMHTSVPYWSFNFYDFKSPSDANPDYWALADARRLQYVAHSLNPLMWLPLLTPVAILALPGFTEVLASHEAITMNFGTHYATTWIGYLLVAFVLGVAALHRRFRFLAAGVLVVAVFSSYHNLVHDDPFARWYYLYRGVDARDVAMASFINTLPPNVDIGAPDHLFAHLGFDPKAALTLDYRFVLVDQRDTALSGTWKLYKATLTNLVHDGRYRPVRNVDGLILYERSP